MKRSIVAVLCAVLVIAAVTLWIAEGYTPEGTVRRYLASLAKGDAETALSMVDPGVPHDQRIFLTNEVLASAASRLEIESIEASSSLIEIVGISRVSATLRLDGHRFTHVFTLDRKDREDSIMSTWTIREGLVVPLKVSGITFPGLASGVPSRTLIRPLQRERNTSSSQASTTFNLREQGNMWTRSPRVPSLRTGRRGVPTRRRTSRWKARSIHN